MKTFQLEKGKNSNQIKGKYSNQEKKNIPIRKLFQLEKLKHSNWKKEYIPIRKRKLFQLGK